MNGRNYRLGCLIIIGAITFNLVAGTWSVLEIFSWLGKTIGWGWATLIGFFVAELTFPVALVGKLLIIFGIF